MTSTIADHEEMGKRWPAVVARADRALAAFAADPRRLACSHVLDGRVAFASVCAEHPSGGVRCPRCEKHHIDRHSGEVESRCDECQAQSELLHPMATFAQVTALEVRDTTGRHRRIAGAVAVDCLGVCPACWTSSMAPTT